jgi:3-dehydroquinate synthase
MTFDCDYMVNQSVAGRHPQENPAMDKELYQRLSVNYNYPVVFTHDVFGPDGSVLQSVLNSAGRKQHRVLIVVDSGVLDNTRNLPDRIDRFERRHQDTVKFIAPPAAIPLNSAQRAHWTLGTGPPTGWKN